MKNIKQTIDEIIKLFKDDEWVDFTIDSYYRNNLIFFVGLDVIPTNIRDIEIIFEDIYFISTFFDFSVSPPDTPNFIKVYALKEAILKGFNMKKGYYLFQILDDNYNECYIIAKNISYKINRKGGRFV